MKKLFSFYFCISIISSAGCAQKGAGADKPVGGPCEGCEAVFESPAPFDSLANLVWLSDWNGNDPKRIAVNGIVYRADGEPAAGVVLYIYHTDTTGVYPTHGNETGWAKRHGYLRGWMKTNSKGEYKFFTLRPGSYPGSHNPAHIHVFVKEEGKSPYWIDDYLFDDDPLLTETERKKLHQRGGNGILKTKDVGNTVKSQRNIYLGKNIPGYPR